MSRPLRAEILAIGSELLAPLRSDTNALWMTGRLLEVGVEVGARITVADDAALLESAFRDALARADVVIATGGLGPTEDDLTREAAAAALGRPLHRDAALLEALKARFARFDRPMAPVNEKQADVIEGAVLLPNARGTAPGQRVEADGRLLFLLPGPPGEMKPMFEEQVLPVVRERAGGTVAAHAHAEIASMGESDVEQLVAPVYKTFANPRTTILGAGRPGRAAPRGRPGPRSRRRRRSIEELAVGDPRAAPRAHLQRGRARAARGGGRAASASGGSRWPSPSRARAACSPRGSRTCPGRALSSSAPS